MSSFENVSRRRGSLVWSAAVLAHLAGASVGLGQDGPIPDMPPEPDMAPSMDAAPFEPTPAERDDRGGKAKGRQGGMGGVGGKSGGRAMTVRVDDNMLVDLHVQDEDLGNVLEMLSIQSQRNIIATKDVSARVTANFYGVTFYQALDAILHANGFGYIEKDSFIFVYTAEQIEQILKSQRQRISKIIRLNYLNAIDAAEFVKPNLSEGGTIKTPGKTAAFPGKSDVPTGADEYSNEATMVVWDFEENVKAIEELIKQLDTRPQQVLVEATILQASLNEANAFGVDFALISDIEFDQFVGVGGPLKIVDALIANNSENLSSPGSGDAPAASGNDGGGIVSSPGNTSGPGTLKFGYINNDVGVFMRVLDEVTDTTVLSNPKILALNRQPARVLVGQRVGYLNTTSTDTATTQTVEFLDTGTQLHFRPFIANDGSIRMELKPQVSTAVIRDVRNSSGSVVTVPDEITNELTTNVMVRDGQTVVLGGLFRDRTRTTRRQVPFLGDIPILGEAFRGHDNEIERTEIIFLITPTIVNDTALASMGATGMEMVERVRTGSREGLLGFSREKRSSQHLIEAERLAAAGDTQKALWKTEQALTMNPRQIDAIALRERLTGEKSKWPTRSMLDEIVTKEAKQKADAAFPDGVPVSFTPATDASGRVITADELVRQNSGEKRERVSVGGKLTDHPTRIFSSPWRSFGASAQDPSASVAAAGNEPAQPTEASAAAQPNPVNAGLGNPALADRIAAQMAAETFQQSPVAIIGNQPATAADEANAQAQANQTQTDQSQADQSRQTPAASQSEPLSARAGDQPVPGVRPTGFGTLFAGMMNSSWRLISGIGGASAGQTVTAAPEEPETSAPEAE